jgi:N utilization substance protein B
MTDRRQARILAMQALCLLEVLGDEMLAQLDDFLADDGAPPDVREYARRLVSHARTNLAALDAELQAHAAHWDVKRMFSIDRNVLRVAACELAVSPELSPKIVINEAIEIARAFGTAESPGFVNGLLDAFVKGGIKHRLDAAPERLTTDH